LYTFQEELFNLKQRTCLRNFEVLTDKPLGGLTTAHLNFTDEEGSEGGCLVFEGNFSSMVPPDAPQHVHRLGQAMFESKVVHPFLSTSRDCMVTRCTGFFCQT
jgi:hypothetical protein